VRHAAATPRYAVIATWLTVTALGIAIGAVGIGGLSDLVGGLGGNGGKGAGGTDAVALTAEQPGSEGGSDGDGSEGVEGQGLGVLVNSRVIAPSELPPGTALPGHAPAALFSKYGNYVPFIPTSMRLPSGRLAPVQPAKVHAGGALDIPANPDRVGWWTGGAQAGEPYGSIVLAGHVDSAAFGIGILSEMLQMRPGQDLKLADGVHGQVYRVQTVQRIAKVKLAAGTDLFDQNVKHRLVMITCGGPFDRHTHSYRDNVVIIATPVQG
jgi:hypothetical protein